MYLLAQWRRRQELCHEVKGAKYKSVWYTASLFALYSVSRLHKRCRCSNACRENSQPPVRHLNVSPTYCVARLIMMKQFLPLKSNHSYQTGEPRRMWTIGMGSGHVLPCLGRKKNWNSKKFLVEKFHLALYRDRRQDVVQEMEGK